MNWKRTLAILLLVTTLILLILLSVKFPFSRTNTFPISNPITVQSEGIPLTVNITLEPEGKTGYHAEVTLSPNSEMDFWAVNSTGFGILDGFLSYGEMFRTEYPDQYPFSVIQTYAKGINVTQGTLFELTNLTYDGQYCLVFLNFFDQSQSATVKVEERYLESVHTILEPNTINTSVTALILAAAFCFLALSRKRPRRRARKP